MSEQPAKLDGLSGVLPTLTSVVDVVGSKLPPEPPSVLALIRERDALKARVTELEAQVPRWIPVTERQPEKLGEYLIAGPSWTGLVYFKPPHELKGVTHWMPLPPAPKEVK